MKFSNEQIAKIKEFIIDNVEQHPNDITSLLMTNFCITRPTAQRYIRLLVEDKILTSPKKGTKPSYELEKEILSFDFLTKDNIEEDKIWITTISQALGELKKNVINAWDYCFLEMMNNAIEHSEASAIRVTIKKDAKKICIIIADDGIGIFNKIQKSAGLLSPKESILELSKGKFTSDPEKHSGEGIFFTSRICDSFAIFSGSLSFLGHDGRDILFEDTLNNSINGTTVFMIINNNSDVNTKNIFDKYTEGAGTAFIKTIIPVKLMQYEGSLLLSRSQARRLINRFDKFQEVVLDFDGVEEIGQAFADEIFRVFHNKHPNVNLGLINCSDDVKWMIRHVSNEFLTD